MYGGIVPLFGNRYYVTFFSHSDADAVSPTYKHRLYKDFHKRQW